MSPSALTHGHTRGRRHTPEYNSWSNMIQRCTNHKKWDYKHYGGRGIKVCDRWRKFANFLADMGHKPSVKHTLERARNNGGYSPSNCLWVLQPKQANNKRNNRWLTYRGKTLTVAQWSRAIGLNMGTLHDRLRQGWSVERTLGSPADRTAIHRAITHCPRGHEYTPENIIWVFNGKKKHKCRRCKTCQREKYRRSKVSK